MGRPLKKDVFGIDAINTFGTATPPDARAGIRVEFYDSALRTDGVILKQRGAKTFRVVRNGDIGTTSAYVTAVLQSAQPSVYGQMRMTGYTDPGNDSSAVAIAKITKRIATDFSGNKYKWRMSDFEDSTGDIIILTAL
jgi:hypothetical protein